MALTKKQRKMVGPLLRRARKLMNSDGAHWIKYRLQGKKNGETAYCAIGGLNAAAGAKQRYMGQRGSGPPNSPDDFPILAEALMVLATQIRGLRPRSVEAAEFIVYSFNDNALDWNLVAEAFEAAGQKADELAQQ